jgi:hypothetical protein
MLDIVLQTPRQNSKSNNSRPTSRVVECVEKTKSDDMAKITLDYDTNGIIMHVENSPQHSGKNSINSFKSFQGNYLS